MSRRAPPTSTTVPSSFADSITLKPRRSRLVHRRVHSLIIVARGKKVDLGRGRVVGVAVRCKRVRVGTGKSAAEHTVARMLC